MNLPSVFKSNTTVFTALFIALIGTAGLSSAGCNSSSGGTGGTPAGGQSGLGGSAGGQAGGQAGGANGQTGGAGGITAAGGSAGNGGAAGASPSLTAACAATAAATSGIDPTTRLDALTLAQQMAYCDWVASRYCGYDQHVHCDDDGTTLDSFVSQAKCLENFDDGTPCASTVGEDEACEKDTTCDNTLPDSCLRVAACE